MYRAYQWRPYTRASQGKCPGKKAFSPGRCPAKIKQRQKFQNDEIQSASDCLQSKQMNADI